MCTPLSIVSISTSSGTTKSESSAGVEGISSKPKFLSPSIPNKFDVCHTEFFANVMSFGNYDDAQSLTSISQTLSLLRPLPIIRFTGLKVKCKQMRIVDTGTLPELQERIARMRVLFFIRAEGDSNILFDGVSGTGVNRYNLSEAVLRYGILAGLVVAANPLAPSHFCGTYVAGQGAEQRRLGCPRMIDEIVRNKDLIVDPNQVHHFLYLCTPETLRLVLSRMNPLPLDIRKTAWLQGTPPEKMAVLEEVIKAYTAKHPEALFHPVPYEVPIWEHLAMSKELFLSLLNSDNDGPYFNSRTIIKALRQSWRSAGGDFVTGDHIFAMLNLYKEMKIPIPEDFVYEAIKGPISHCLRTLNEKFIKQVLSCGIPYDRSLLLAHVFSAGRICRDISLYCYLLSQGFEPTRDMLHHYIKMGPSHFIEEGVDLILTGRLSGELISSIRIAPTAETIQLLRRDASEDYRMSPSIGRRLRVCPSVDDRRVVADKLERMLVSSISSATSSSSASSSSFSAGAH